MKNLDALYYFAKLTFFRKLQVSEELLESFGITPSNDEGLLHGTRKFVCDTISRLNKDFRASLRKYLALRTEKIDRRLQEDDITLKDMDETERQSRLRGFWNGGPKQEAIAMWESIADVIDFDVIFLPPEELPKHERVRLALWRRYLRQCFMRSIEVYLNHDSYGATRTFYTAWSKMIERGEIVKPPGFSWIPLSASIELLQVAKNQ